VITHSERRGFDAARFCKGTLKVHRILLETNKLVRRLLTERSVTFLKKGKTRNWSIVNQVIVITVNIFKKRMDRNRFEWIKKDPKISRLGKHETD
jgi:hypothetical protein